MKFLYVSIILYLIPLLTCSSSDSFWHLPWYSYKPLDQSMIISNSDWMQKIDDNANLTSLAIPGTHDSCTDKFIYSTFLFELIANLFGRTQTWGIKDQLDAGIRYLDLRVGNDGKIYHSVLQTSYSIMSVFQIVEDFLNQHQSEGIVMRIQYNYDEGLCKEDCLHKNVIDILEQYKDILLLSSELPLMKDLRGKIFLLLQFFDYDNALKWDSYKIILQDEYKLNGENETEAIKYKEQYVQKYLEKSKSSDNLIINHCSASAFEYLLSLTEISRNVNKVPYDYNDFRGIIAMDFPGEELINHIINQNGNIILPHSKNKKRFFLL